MCDEQLEHITPDPPEIKDERWDCKKCGQRFYDHEDACKHVEKHNPLI